jgi:LacI family transcriptional regulator, galactose operon repressor
MKRPTISDVAERAAVSKATVSHVINQTRFVEEDTRQRVLQAVAALGYRPSTVARSLTTNRTQMIGVIVSDASNYFFAEVLQGIEAVLRPVDYALIICNTTEILEREAHYLDLLVRQRVDGIIAAATSQRWDVLTEVDTQHIPVVFVDRYFEGLNSPFVGVDNRKGASLGTTHLIQRGYRRIGILAGFQRLSTMRDRLAGFRQTLQEHAIPLAEEWVITSPLSIEGGCEAMRRLMTLTERPDAVFFNNNLLAAGGLLAIQELGLRCPEHVGLLTFDDHPWAAVSCPPLTVVYQPSREVGQIAAQMILNLINGRLPDVSHVILECQLIVRQSC